MRPSFEPPLRPVWRSSDRLQLGEASLVGVTPEEVRALSRLDGSLPGDLIAAAQPRLGLAAGLLRLVGAVGDGPSSRRGSDAESIRIDGDGELAEAARGLLGSAARDDAPQVLLCSTGSAEPVRARGDALTVARVRHLTAFLPTELSPSRSVVIGPLVEPGIYGSCLRCQHLTRCDRDPSWPVIAAQLATPQPSSLEPSLTSRVLAVIGAALAIEQLLCPPGTATTLSGTVEWVDGQLRRRSWPRHPECPLHHSPAATTSRSRAATRWSEG